MKIFHLVLGLALGLTLALPASADPAPRRQGGGALQTLGLTKEQKKQIHDIMQNTPKGPQRRAAVMKVLTPEQQAKFKAQMGSHQRPAAEKTPAMSDEDYDK